MSTGGSGDISGAGVMTGERTGVLHKFEEFLADLAVRKERVDEVNRYANECAEVRWGITEANPGKGFTVFKKIAWPFSKRDKKDI